MSIPKEIITQLLPKPPKLLPDGNGYDWREFDRWMQRIWRLLGAPQTAGAFNIASSVSQNFDEQIALDFSIDHSLEIQLLRQRVEQIALEIDMLSDQQREVAALKRQISDIYTELGGAS